MVKCWLTNGGNILVKGLENWMFFKPDLSFIRQVTEAEGEYLSSVCLLIEFNIMAHSQFVEYVVGVEPLPVWHYLISVQTIQDNTNYRYETSNNGGDYSFSTYREYFCCQINGQWKFAYMEVHKTSAEFSYDKINKQFQSNLAGVHCINAMNGEQPIQYSTQTRSGEWEDCVLEEISSFTLCTYEDILKTPYTYFSSRYDEGEKKCTLEGLSEKELDMFYYQLKQLGWNISQL
jgi:hypothetical protein